MAFEANYQTINSCFRKALGNKQTMIECKLEAMANTTIAKILCMKAEYIPKGTTLNEGEAKRLGEVKFEVIYSSEDGQICKINNTVLVENIVKNSEINSEMFPLVKTQVVDLKVSNVRPNIVIMTAVIDYELNAMVVEDIKCIQDLGEEVITQKEMIEYCQTNSQGISGFNFQEELEIKEEVSKVLMSSVNMCVNEVYAGTGYIVVKGNMSVNITYLKAGEEEQLKSILKIIPFKEEIEAVGVTPESSVNMICSISYDKVDIFANNIEKNTILKMDIPVQCCFLTTEKKKMEVINDVFSKTNKVNVVAESFNKCKCKAFKQVVETVSTAVDIDNGNYEIESIAADCGAGAFVAKSFAMDGYVVVEGVAHINVVYYTLSPEEELMYDSIEVDVPFSVDVECTYATDKNEVLAWVAPKEVCLRAKRGNKLDVDMDLSICFDIWENEQDMVVTEVTMGESLDQNMSALKMYIIKEGSSMWDACKEAMVDPETILTQNPNIEFPLEKDTMIIVFKQKEELY